MSTTITPTTAQKKSASACCSFVSICAFFSIFMMLVTLSADPRGELVDSQEQVQKTADKMKQVSEQLGPSLPKMVNFTWEDGSDWQTPWVDLPWVRKLHFGILPVGTWLTVAPFQLSSWFRSNYPQLHRKMGYMFILSSISLSIGLSLLIKSGKVMGHPHWMAMAMNILKLGYFVASLGLAFRFAIRQEYNMHRRWMIRHVAMGYSVSFQRVLLLIVGPLLHASGLLGGTELTGPEMGVWYNLTTLVGAAIPMALVEDYLRQTPVDVVPSKNKSV